jgi:hypothetical protein
MLYQIVKKIPTWLWTLLYLAGVVSMDREHFFPLSAHSDLKFQIVGESLELLALVGIGVLPRLLLPRDTETPDAESPVTPPGAFVGAIVAAFLLSIFWRDYFPNDKFNSGELLGYSLFAGVVILLFSLIPPSKKGKPSREEESSIV